MILARISKAIREQNWFAVGLEFVIVISGVVIGFEVSGAGERAAREAYEHDLLERLERQILTLEEGRDYNESWLVITRDRLVAVRPGLFGAEPLSELNTPQCFALLGSHLIATPSDSLPALDELISTGRMDSIRNNDIRDAAGRYLQVRDSAREQVAAVLADMRSLPDLFPDYFRIELYPDPDEDDDGWDRRAHCDLESMRADNAFLLAASGNIEQYRGILSFNYDFVGQVLQTLHDAIDAELGLSHDDTET